MTWEIAKTDELGIESFIKASDSGIQLYKKFGYRNLMKVSVDVSKKDPSDKRKRLSHELLHIDFFCIWRPAGGVFEQGKPQIQW